MDRLRRAFRPEDLLLTGWIVLVEPLLTPAGVSTPDARNILEGVFGLAGLAGLAICIGARSATGVVSGLSFAGQPAWTVGPLSGAVALVAGETMNDLGLVEGGPILALGLVVLAIVARFRVPPLAAGLRRTLVTPFVLVAGGSFGEFLIGLSDLFDLGDLVSGFQAGGIDVGLALFVLGLALLGVLVFYVMLVFAPRQVAELEGTPGTWALRFLLFGVSLVLAATWAGFIRG